MIGIVDCDILLFRCGFAAEKKSKRRLEDGTIEHHREVEPFGFAVQNVQTVLHALKKHFNKLELYLSGKDNFRYKVATILPYKGNRTAFSKPVHYDELKEYLTKRCGAIVVDGREADDEIGIRATVPGSDGCIVSVDKDLLQIPGNHYNWVKQEWQKVSEVEGLRMFYRQMLMGDKAVDNIPGIEGVGPKNASMIVDPYTKEIGMWQAVKEEWHNRYPEGFHGHSVDKVLNEIGQLLWIQRTGREKWEPPKT